jgi:hypothetical protein
MIHGPDCNGNGLDGIDALSYADVEILMCPDAISDGQQDIADSAEG